MSAPPFRPTIIQSPDQLGRLLRERREALGLAVADVAVDAEVPAKSLGLAEKALCSSSAGRKWFTATLLWWAQALGLRVVLMDDSGATALREASTAPAMEVSVPVAAAGRDGTARSRYARP